MNRVSITHPLPGGGMIFIHRTDCPAHGIGFRVVVQSKDGTKEMSRQWLHSNWDYLLQITSAARRITKAEGIEMKAYYGAL